jgi:plasmid segregation protein ParM
MEMVHVGIDVGYGTTKTVKSNSESSIFRSVVGYGTPDTMGTSSVNAVIVNVGKDQYTVGEEAERFKLPPVQTRTQNSIESIAYKALVLAALNGDRNAGLKIVTGLPVEYHMNDKEKLFEVFKDLFPNSEVKVVPQPVGTLYDLVFDTNGNIQNPNIVEKKVGVIDIGTLTTDLVLFDKMHLIRPLSSTIEVGIDRFINDIAKDYPGLRLSQSEIEEALKTGQIKRHDKLINIRDNLIAKKSSIARNIWSFVSSLWGPDENIDYYVISGGGAVMFRDAFVQSNLIMPRNAVMSNAYGFYKLARRIWL